VCDLGHVGRFALLLEGRKKKRRQDPPFLWLDVRVARRVARKQFSSRSGGQGAGKKEDGDVKSKGRTPKGQTRRTGRSACATGILDAGGQALNGSGLLKAIRQFEGGRGGPSPKGTMYRAPTKGQTRARRHECLCYRDFGCRRSGSQRFRLVEGDTAIRRREGGPSPKGTMYRAPTKGQTRRTGRSACATGQCAVIRG